ncbi:MAG: carboxypeptidase regulatory-like domain-containing protein, partial [Candidatus Acidiferrales bacterium]
MKRIAALLLLCAFVLFAQANDGELHLKITDPSGLGVKTTVDIRSEANQYHNTLETDEEGKAVAKNLPYGVYRITIREPGFAEVSRKVEVRSSVPTNYEIKLELSPVNAAVTVTEASTLINPDQAGSVNQIGSSTIQDRFTSLPGRSLQDLVNSQPGWLYEGNAVLHPRGSEYQTQFVIDGIPLTDNRSPSLGPEIEAADVQSMTVYTAGIPAEYGRKMGGVIEVNTIPDTQPGFHGQAVLSGGSFNTAGMFGQAQYAWGKNSVAFSADGSTTDHYLNPVVPENLTNAGTTGDFSVDFERDLTSKDHLDLTVRHELARYEIPNEFDQQAAGQRQDADNFETMGIASYQHVFSANAVADVRAMVRENSNDFNSNANSTPVGVFQHNWFREGYFKGSVTIDHGHHEWKFGAESDNMFLNENFRYAITDPTQFEPGTPLTFSFLANRPDLEQS